MLKKRLAYGSLALVLLVTTVLVAQSGSSGKDSEQIQRQLEIMKGVLSATLEFSDLPDIGHRQIESYYLPKQGAVFLIPVSRGTHYYAFDLDNLVGSLAQVEAGTHASEMYVRSLERSLERQMRDLERLEYSGVAGVLAPPPPAPLPPAPPEPPAAAESPPSEASREEIEKRLQSVRQKLDEQKKELEQKQREQQQQLDALESELLEAVAQHGDSLSVVGSGEYVTLILTSTGHFRGLMGRRDRDRARILVVSKSSILDYNAGRLNAQSFKNSVLRVEM